MKDENIIEEVVNNFGFISENVGLGKVVGFVYGTLYFDGEMTQLGIKSRLQVGLSSISQALTVLEKFGFVEVVRKEGRKNVYGISHNCGAIENLMRFSFEPLSRLLKSRIELVKDKSIRVKIKNLEKGLTALNSKMGKTIQ